MRLHSVPPCVSQDNMKSGTDDVRAVALEAVGNLAFPRRNRSVILSAPGLKLLLSRLSQSDAGTVKQRVRMAAIRALAILGGSGLRV
jgi:hypothetical protein